MTSSQVGLLGRPMENYTTDLQLFVAIILQTNHLSKLFSNDKKQL